MWFGVRLRGDQRQQRGARGADRGQRRQHRLPALAQSDREPDGLDPDREEGEVVAAEGERRGERPERQFAWSAAAVEGPQEEEEGERAEEDEQRVGAGLLRVPDQHRVEGEEAGEDEADAAARELPADRVAERDGERPEQRRERADAPFVAAEGFRPTPGEDVVERRVRLARLHLVQHVAEAAGDHPHHRDHLVVVEALDAERGEADRRPGGGQPGDRGDDRPATRGRLLAWIGEGWDGAWSSRNGGRGVLHCRNSAPGG